MFEKTKTNPSPPSLLGQDFTFLLGSTNSQPITGHAKPFSTSVFKVRI